MRLPHGSRYVRLRLRRDPGAPLPGPTLAWFALGFGIRAGTFASSNSASTMPVAARKRKLGMTPRRELAWRERNCRIRAQYSSSNTACSIRFPTEFECCKSKNAVFECSFRTIRSGSNEYFIEYSFRCSIRLQYSNDKKWPYFTMYGSYVPLNGAVQLVFDESFKCTAHMYGSIVWLVYRVLELAAFFSFWAAACTLSLAILSVQCSIGD
jgi:hypothetical protein